MITGCTAKIGNRTYNRQMFALLGRHRQMFTDIDIWCGGLNGAEGTTVFNGGLRLHVPHIEMRRSAVEENDDTGIGFCGLTGAVAGQQLRQ